MTAPHYHINLFWSNDDGCWIADVPVLKYCSAHRDTPGEAIAEVQEAIEGWLGAAGNLGLPEPEPRYRPANYSAG